MSLNKYMHPRNIYKTPPNFKQLAIDFPEFRAYVKQDVSGKVAIDFKDIKALRALTCTLLKKDFGLDVEIPLTRMIPTVPLRLNYILWIEDLLSISGELDNINGIDIGTGASCIYPLLAAKSKGWSMLASDVDKESLDFAKNNIERNCLSNLITVKHVSETTRLKEAINDDPTKKFDFCMCNPPFFSSTQELNPTYKARRPDRPRPRNAFCATTGEVVADGGEVNFIKKLIEESQELERRIKIYTSMIGHKSNLSPLKNLLREADVVSFKQTEFYQGHTTRWALAWTYHDIDLRKIPEATVTAARKSKPKPPLQYELPTEQEVNLKDVSEKLVDMFNKLQMDYNVVKESKNVLGYCTTARSNTWSHQRRKRREQQRLNSLLNENNNEYKLSSPSTSSNDGNSSLDVQNASEQVAKMKVTSPSLKSPSKRELDDDGFYNYKKMKTDSYDDCYLKTSLVVRKNDSNIVIELLYLEGSAGKEGIHQVLQYIKNNFKL
ncbi:hypothetical protein ILUMI_22685 [Ignelater luminosus]|uniref:U6 small nuclear RNA (adenine-(43)-N(6))-methyltransferase n=1 Tax=Ignelater luminosus TaxID=2038154 RepID=A0A8K0G0B7_IGNLU|nr:hypothetical protein ILUMI_22685 [Ignelater luminosus]